MGAQRPCDKPVVRLADYERAATCALPYCQEPRVFARAYCAKHEHDYTHGRAA